MTQFTVIDGKRKPKNFYPFTCTADSFMAAVKLYWKRHGVLKSYRGDDILTVINHEKKLECFTVDEIMQARNN